MRVLSGLLVCLLTNEYLSGAIGFWVPFKHKNAPVKKSSKIKETKEILYEEGNWDDGEVAWENMQDYNDTNETYTFIKIKSLENTDPLYKITPLYEAIEMDQTKIASISALVRTTYRETFNDLGTGGSATLDLSTANNFRRQFNGTSTITITNAPNSPIGFGFTLVTVNAGAYSITWPVSVDWVGGSAPILTSSGTDVLVFYSYNGGSSYYGFVTGKNLS